MEVIKRYQNRKLYSTTGSHYVKLEYVLDLVRTKQKFMVIDNKTKADITSKTKKQAVQLLNLSDEAVTQLIRSTM